MPYVVALWADHNRLDRLIAEHRDELGDDEQALMKDRLLRPARAEFAAGRFAPALQA